MEARPAITGARCEGAPKSPLAHRIFDASRLVPIEGAFRAPPADMMARIVRAPYGGQERYDVGITFVAI
jgi:hypothetical protein